MKSYNILFMGTPEFARVHLEVLLQQPRFKVVGVVTQPDRPAGRKMQLQKSPVRAFAESQGLKVLTPESIKSPEALAEIKALGAEAVAVVAYGQILSRDFLGLFANKVVNVHGSLLPRWRGAAPIQRAIMAGDTMTGVCLQVMVYELDAGDVIGERKVQIDPQTSASDLYAKLPQLGGELLTKEFLAYLDGRLKPKKQDEKFMTLAPKISKHEAKINWSCTAQEVHNLVRGLSMGPFAWTLWQGQALKIHKTQVVLEQSGRPGEVIEIAPQGLLIGCGKNALRVLEIQPESRARMDVQSFLAGHRVQKGDVFG